MWALPEIAPEPTINKPTKAECKVKFKYVSYLDRKEDWKKEKIKKKPFTSTKYTPKHS